MKALLKNKRGVSPVVGVMLMVGIVVLLVITIGGYTTFNVQDTIENTQENKDRLIDDVRSVENEGNDANNGGDGSSEPVASSEPHSSSPTCSEIEYNESDGHKEITNDHELQCISEDPDADYILTRPIDATETNEWNGGDGFNPVDLNGSIDGDGYDVDGLTVNRPSENHPAFLSSNQGTVENIGFTNIDIYGFQSSGGLIGISEDGFVSNVHVSGTVESETGTVGGLIGINNNTDVTKSHTDVIVTTSEEMEGYGGGGLIGLNNNGDVSKSYATGDVTGGTIIGGLIGDNNHGTITNSYATGNVNGNSIVGGFVGRQIDAEVSNSYSTGQVNGAISVGGFTANVEDDAEISNSYWDTDSSGVSDSSGDAEGLITDEMQGSDVESNMNGFDFGSVWETTEKYPELS